MLLNYFKMLRAEFRGLLVMLEQLPSYPYSPFYARWETVLHLRMDLLRQQVAEARQVRDLGLVETRHGWVVPEKPPHKPSAEE